MRTGHQAPAADLVLENTEFGQDIRWRPGERLEQLFEEQCDRMREAGLAHHLAVDAEDEVLTYQQLDGRANRLARYLLDLGVGPGGRVALLVDRAVQAYVGMLAVLKAGAAYVPLDAGFPPDRLSYIVADAGVGVVLSVEHLRPHLGAVGVEVVCLDAVASEIEAHDDGRLRTDERGEAEDADGDDLAYIIYTSGSTGRPKGVAIEHASICNFVRVAADVYGIRPDDRMYQGLTIAFDFSVEEIWVPWIVGATLVPRPPGPSLLGSELRDFLTARRVTAMCCVPTLLATLDEDLPDLRFLLVSGEACPHDLIVRWHREGRRFLNVYGPTEATVTATWTVAHPDRAVTIGGPLPTYSIVVLDPDDPRRALPPGDVGEIGIAGIGLARGYVRRDDLTAKAFVPDFLDITGNPSGRIYRTGDLGRVNADGEIEYLGRIDLQVKIRGYRIELTEIESVMLQVPGIAQAVVDTYEPVPGTVELVGYYSLRHNVSEPAPEDISALLRDRLPPYMVPAYLERLPVIPMTTSDKADRKRLPPPTSRSVAVGRAYRPPTSGTEEVLAGVLARTLGTDRVSVDSHFFDDLGANSLLMARFSARVRKETELQPPAMKDLYLNPTVAKLAAALPAQPVQPGQGDAGPVDDDVPRTGTVRYVLFGVVQLLIFLGSVHLGMLVLVAGITWVAEPAALGGRLIRSAVLGLGLLVLACVGPILVKWLLVGRWKRHEFRLWGLAHLRFWYVTSLVRIDPLVLFAGSPLYVLYLRALGAHIGRGVAVFSRRVPTCTDLLTIGDGTVIRKDTSFTCHRGEAGRIRTGTVSLGRDVVVGEASVLDIETALGDGAQLGHASALYARQVVPAGERWHGSPAEPTGTDFRAIEARQCGTLRRFLYTMWQLVLLTLAVSVPVAVLVLLPTLVPQLADVLGHGHQSIGDPTLYAVIGVVTIAILLGGLVVGLVAVLTVPRLLNLFVRPDAVHPLYGVQFWLCQMITLLTNTGFTRLLGDSAYVTHYLSALGYHLAPVEQTGSNFGLIMKHESPYLSTVGTGSMISDGLSISNIDYTSTSFRATRVVIGKRSFLGNHISYPAGSRAGDNCLIATKAMVPVDGPTRTGVGLLGSPSFQIPRSVQRDGRFDHLTRPDVLQRRLAAKTRHNTVTIALHLFVLWLLTVPWIAAALAAADLFYLLGASGLTCAVLVVLVLDTVVLVVAERASTAFRSLQPQFCSIYQPYFWSHERFWKLTTTSFFDMYNGTPFKGTIWRLLGVRIGRRVFDEGCSIPEKSLVTVGDDCTLNAGSALWGHSLEDGTFKSDRIRVGRGCTLGVAAFVHYGVTMGDGAVLGADAFLMKGEEVAPGTRWRGNPAAETRRLTPSRASAADGDAA
ncbi:Pls/PosA family non-ribosomal peptide synthetase [Pseudonocardia cypriaca]|uniref:Non-ribosomal peptide synthetase-like protein n=1 Tax=Pseudonocardia cypriaca TaxID=882449 RepID=A0A543GES1_9PSEU|nr:Pls/PosA family non-ribosomal peptide synthetase [Pseudonocardia cypriaca]TQM44563.1 non-ribosomal peptide synthetase-like protein [Pseudonocardia cypriaca]